MCASRSSFFQKTILQCEHSNFNFDKRSELIHNEKIGFIDESDDEIDYMKEKRKINVIFAIRNFKENMDLKNILQLYMKVKSLNFVQYVGILQPIVVS